MYQMSLDTFVNFRESMALCDMWPIPLNHITHFIAYLSLNGFSPSTIISYISGLNFFHNLRNYGDITEAFVVQKMLTGMTRSNSKSKDSRLPITYNILKEITSVLPAICSSDYEIRLFTAAFVLAFFAFLRVGEITSSQTNKQI